MASQCSRAIDHATSSASSAQLVANTSVSAGPRTLDRVLGRVARLGDGWMTFGSAPEVLRSGLRVRRCHAPEIDRKLSLRASVTSELVLDDVSCPIPPSFRGRRDFEDRCPA